MSFNANRVHIEFLDGTNVSFDWVTRELVADGVLYLFSQNGTYAEEEHLGSYPTINIRSWKRTRR